MMFDFATIKVFKTLKVGEYRQSRFGTSSMVVHCARNGKSLYNGLLVGNQQGQRIYIEIL
jgi:hypothetical protein